ncbi:MAG: hypothetical protein ABS76_23800 [Pelagibacterium sp. SCN 64-44]|nr:MAG: hypothetical protein ABS76_23800 [Pelagibacterium sp. SCN 64-44]
MKPAIAVQLVTAGEPVPAPAPGTALLILPAGSGHEHPDGATCPACAAATDVRALLFDLLESARQGLRPAFTRVVVDARAVPDAARVVAALEGKLPATALRDHEVARRFFLEA